MCPLNIIMETKIRNTLLNVNPLYRKMNIWRNISVQNYRPLQLLMILRLSAVIN